jgi:Flp pilus assembly protein TadG
VSGPRGRDTRWARTLGQGLTEFALALPVFCLIVGGLIEGGHLVYAYNSVAQSAREAARLASVEAPYIGKASPCGAPVCPTASTFPTDVRNAANRMNPGVTISKVTITCTLANGSGASAGCATAASRAAGKDNWVTVTIDSLVAPLTPVMSVPYPSGITVSATSKMQIP